MNESEYATWLGAELHRCQRIQDPTEREKCIQEVIELARIERELEEEAGFPW